MKPGSVIYVSERWEKTGVNRYGSLSPCRPKYPTRLEYNPVYLLYPETLTLTRNLWSEVELVNGIREEVADVVLGPMTNGPGLVEVVAGRTKERVT